MIATQARLADTISTFQKWLYLPDPGPLLAAAASIAANRMAGDPVWLLIVGPPGGGKSEIVQSFRKVQHIHPAATLTEASLLSGTPKRDVDDQARGGLLRTIGPFGILLLKDFTSILSMHRDERGRVLSALREIYDGSWTRHVGVDGGKTLHWQGRIGLLGGVTPTIDRHHAVMGSMGERFIFYRLEHVDEIEQARTSLTHAGHETAMRHELAEAALELLNHEIPNPREPQPEEIDRLISLSRLVVRARSAVERDSYTRDIELIGDAEAPTRLIIVLKRMLGGLEAIGCTTDESWHILTKIAFDSMPQLRRQLIDALYQETDMVETTTLSELLRYPPTTTRRALEDLTVHGLVTRVYQGDGKPNLWQLTDWTNQRLSDLAYNRSRFVVLSKVEDIKREKLGTDKTGKVSANGSDPDDDIPF